MSENGGIKVVITKLSELGKTGASYEAFLTNYHQKVIDTVESVSGHRVELVRNATEVYFLVNGAKLSYAGVSDWMTNWVAKGEQLEQQVARIGAAIGATAIFTPEKSTLEIRRKGELLLLINLKTKDMKLSSYKVSSQIYPYLDRIGKLVDQH